MDLDVCCEIVSDCVLRRGIVMVVIVEDIEALLDIDTLDVMVSVLDREKELLLENVAESKSVLVSLTVEDNVSVNEGVAD